MGICYRYSETTDVHERLEDCALALAIHDAAQKVQLLKPDSEPVGDLWFGRRKPTETNHRWHSNKIGYGYWEDPTFSRNARRWFKQTNMDQAEKLCSENPKGVFVKVPRLKQNRQKSTAVCHGHLLSGFDCAVMWMEDDDVFLVQELVEIKHEIRVFVLDGRVVCASNIHWANTPISPTFNEQELLQFDSVISDFEKNCGYKFYTLDVALINGEPGVVELNPFAPGAVGLYNCDIGKLAAGIVNAYSPRFIP